MEMELVVGPQGIVSADGASIECRGGRTGEMVVQELHGRYYESMRSGLMFSAANQAAQAVSVALSTTYTGILLYNPVGSNRILVPNKIKYALTVAQVAIASIGLIAGTSVTTQTTQLGIQCNQIGNAATGVGKVMSAATTGTPTWIAHNIDGFTAGALSAPTPMVDLEGVFGILPGAFIAIGALTAVTGLGFISWEEIQMNSTSNP